MRAKSIGVSDVHAQRESMASGAAGGSDAGATTALLAERNALAARVTEQETRAAAADETARGATEEKNVLLRQLGQLKEQNSELEEKVKVREFGQLLGIPKITRHTPDM